MSTERIKVNKNIHNIDNKIHYHIIHAVIIREKGWKLVYIRISIHLSGKRI
jgi:hypothetical protein